MNKDAIFADVQRRMAEWYPESRQHGRCLYWSHAGVVTLYQHGIKSVVVAGTACWTWPTARWAFEWNGKDTPDRRFGKLHDDTRKPLPEMHCWILTKDRPFIDFSLCELRATINAITSEDWSEVVTPSYLWAPTDAMPSGFIYQPSMAATKLAVEKIVSEQKENV